MVFNIILLGGLILMFLRKYLSPIFIISKEKYVYGRETYARIFYGLLVV